MTHFCKICNAVPAGVLHACVGQPSVDPAAWARSAAAFGAKPVDYAEAKRLCEERINEIVQLKAKVEKQDRELGPLREFHRCFQDQGSHLTTVFPLGNAELKLVRDKWLAAKPKGET